MEAKVPEKIRLDNFKREKLTKASNLQQKLRRLMTNINTSSILGVNTWKKMKLPTLAPSLLLLQIYLSTKQDGPSQPLNKRLNTKTQRGTHHSHTSHTHLIPNTPGYIRAYLSKNYNKQDATHTSYIVTYTNKTVVATNHQQNSNKTSSIQEPHKPHRKQTPKDTHSPPKHNQLSEHPQPGPSNATLNWETQHSSISTHQETHTYKRTNSSAIYPCITDFKNYPTLPKGNQPLKEEIKTKAHQNNRPFNKTRITHTATLIIASFLTWTRAIRLIQIGRENNVGRNTPIILLYSCIAKINNFTTSIKKTTSFPQYYKKTPTPFRLIHLHNNSYLLKCTNPHQVQQIRNIKSIRNVKVSFQPHWCKYSKYRRTQEQLKQSNGTKTSPTTTQNNQ
ncbi:hypothetical protein CHS0354_012981 [Potamilus streckersoni]|uniref:Uncharacterized protein n=1 Tax=Potamilus streckersoni TaxID=2493646 RepID=A0AAE0W8A4_9BIVA|nr:hypothetical protein CHS0354_012981 [Potamilus streckersoni]